MWVLLVAVPRAHCVQACLQAHQRTLLCTRAAGSRLLLSTHSQLHLVDLASSENLRNGGSAHSQGAAVINQSLCHLNRVLEMLFRGARVPTYR